MLLFPRTHGDDERRRRLAARRLARWLNARDIPGVDPFTWQERLLFWAFVLAVVLIVLFGSAMMPSR